MDNERVILLVEDNSDDEELAKRALKKNNIDNRIVVAHDGVEALEYLLGTDDAQHEDRVMPTLVLLDLNLPKVNGLDVLKQLREHERTRRLPVVVLTTSNEQADVLSSYDLGANSYVRKPIGFSDFIEAVRQLGSYWLALNEGPPNEPAVHSD